MTIRLESVRSLFDQGAILEIQDGNHGAIHPKSSDYVPVGIPFIMAGDLTDGVPDLARCKHITSDQARKLRIGFAQTGDVLLSHKGNLGLAALVPPVDPYVVLTPQVTYYRVDPALLDPRYLMYVFRSPGFHNQMEAIGNQSTRPFVSITAQRSLLIPMRPISEQRRIAAVLALYDDLMTTGRRRVEILQEIARRIYREWFVDFRYAGHEDVPLRESDLGPIPTGWEVGRFIDIAEILGGGTPRTTEPTFWDGAIPFYTPRDATDSFVVIETEKHLSELGLSNCNSPLYDRGTVFITARGTVGKVAMAGKPMAMNQSCYAIRGIGGVDQEYLLLTLMAQVGYLKTNTGGATFETIIIDTFRHMRIPCPPVELINRFSALIRPLIEAVRVLREANRNLLSTRALLLPRLISGTIDVKGITIESGDGAA